MKTVFFLASFLFLLSCGKSDLTVRLVVPPGTPDSSVICIAGNHPALGSWDPGKITLNPESDSVWVFTGSFEKTDTVEFKITRGNWNRQIMMVPGILPGNTTVLMNEDREITLRPVAWSDVWFSEHQGITGLSEKISGLAAAGLNFPKDIVVWLPPSYKTDIKKRYPVLYLHDGQNVFDPSTSFNGTEWRADETADSLIRAGKIEELILVAISNSADRTPEYSDTDLGNAYLDFVAGHLKPMIDKRYRTRPDPANTAVMGSSMGGLASFLFVWKRPDVFGKAACLSSAFLIDDYKIVKEVESWEGEKKQIRVYLDDGTAGLEEKLRPGYDRMLTALISKGFQDSTDVLGFIDEGAEHNEAAWAKRLPVSLGFLFGRKP